MEALLCSAKDNTSQNVSVMSSYRDVQKQKQVFDNTQASEKGNAAPAGFSEHETGLALDLYVIGFAGKNFVKTDAGKWINENCWREGFIIRYPPSKKNVTGYSYEPWHIRYVGKPHSEIIHDNGFTLEEYIDSLKVGKFYEFNNTVIYKIKPSGKEIEIPQESPDRTFKISPDNLGDYIITVYLS